MFTRFKVLSIAAIFVISLVLLTIFFSNDGILANKSTESRINSIREEVKQKESDLNSLRYRAQSSSSSDLSHGSVIYSFTDEGIYDPASERSDEEESTPYEGLTFLSILLISSALAAVYSVIVLLIVPLSCKRKKGENNGKNNQSHER